MSSHPSASPSFFRASAANHRVHELPIHKIAVSLVSCVKGGSARANRKDWSVLTENIGMRRETKSFSGGYSSLHSADLESQSPSVSNAEENDRLLIKSGKDIIIFALEGAALLSAVFFKTVIKT